MGWLGWYDVIWLPLVRARWEWFQTMLVAPVRYPRQYQVCWNQKLLPISDASKCITCITNGSNHRRLRKGCKPRNHCMCEPGGRNGQYFPHNLCSLASTWYGKISKKNKIIRLQVMGPPPCIRCLHFRRPRFYCSIIRLAGASSSVATVVCALHRSRVNF